MEANKKNGEITIAASQFLKEREYWINKLSGDLIKSSFFYDPLKPGAGNSNNQHRFETVEFILKEELQSKLSKLSGCSDSRLFMILTAGLMTILYKYTGNRDIVVGTSIEKQQVEGDFINTVLPLRNQITPPMTFKELLLEVRETIIGAMENKNYPIEALLNDLNISSSVGQAFPLFDIAIFMENIQSREYLRHITLNMIFSFLKVGNTLEGVVEFNASFYRKSSIERIIDHFILNLQQVLLNPGMPLSHIEILAEEEKHCLLFEFNNTETRYPGDKLLHEWFEEEVGKRPGKVVLVFEDKHLTYMELNKRSNRLAALLREKGVTADTIVGIMVHISPEMVSGILAILKAGGAFLPIEPVFPEARIGYIIADSHTPVVLTQTSLQDKISFRGELINLHKGLPVDAGNSNPAKTNQPTNLAYVIYTSGSTGKPKGVMIRHYNIVNQISGLKKMYAFRYWQNHILMAPFTFDPSVQQIFLPLSTGARLFLVSNYIKSDGKKLYRFLRQNHIDVLNTVPSLMSALVDSPDTGDNKRLHFEYIILAGEVFPADLYLKLKRCFIAKKIMNIYGPTEATINTTLYQCKEEEENPVIPIGKPLFNYNVWIVDKHLNMLPIGVPGELCISGEGLARGYLNNPGLTHESCPAHPFIPGERLYRTGDFANWLPDGNLEFHGRIDQQVKIRGQRVEPEEIEIQLLSHPTVKEAAVLAKEDKRKRNYYLSAYMVSNGELNMPGIIKHLATHLPDYMIPGQFIELEQMPLTPNGKIDRKKLLKLDKGKEINVEYVAPRNESEEILAELWKSELELEKVGIKNNYFNIGGDSITSIKLVNLINEKFAAAIEVADLYSYNTVEKLADKIAADKMNFNDGSLKQDDERRIEAIASLPFLKEESQDVYPMSDIQKGMVFDFMKDTKNSFYHVQLIFRIKYKEFDALQLKKAFSLLVKKHSILRTHFNLYDYSEPVQIVHKEMPPDVEHLDITHLEKPGQEDLIYRFLREDREKSFNIGEAAPLWRVRTFALDKENIFFIWIGHHAIIDGWGFSSLLTELNHIYFKLASTTSFVPASLKNTYKEFVIEQIVESKNSDTINYWKKELAGYKRFDFSTMVKNSDSRKGKKVYTENLGTRLLEKLEKTAKKYDTSVKHLCFGAYAYMLSTIACQDDIVVGLLTNSRPQCEDGDKIIGCFLNTVPVRMKIPRNTVWLDYLDAVEKKMRQLKKFDKISLYMIARGTGEKVQDKNPLFDTVFNYTDFHIYNKAHWEMMQIKAADNDDDPFSLEGAINTNPLFNFYIDVTGGNFHITVYFANTLIDPELAGNLFTCFRRILEKMADKPASMMEKTELITVTEKYLYDFQAKAASKKAWEKYLEFYEEPASIPGKIAAIEGTGNVGEKIDRKHVATALEREETTGLNRLALQERVALSTILKTTWGVLLSKYNGRRDVVFDTIVPCPYPGQKTVVIPVRIRYGKETTFNELLQKVERETLELTKILPVSVLKRNLIDHILVAKKNPNPGPVEVTRHEYDFHIILSWGDRVTAAVKYNANVYKREVIERITADYGRLLKFFSEDINTRITGLRLESRVSILKKANINFEFNI